MTFLLEIVRLGLTNLRLHLLRSFLTALGIILGVAAVIAMVAMGEGSKQEALKQIESLGARNIIIRSQKPAESTQQQSGQQRSFVLKYGITRDDLAVIQANFPEADAIVPLKEIGAQVIRGDRQLVSQAFGTTPDLLRVANLTVRQGGRYLAEQDLEDRAMVAVIGADVARALFPWDDPIGRTFRIDDKAFTVVGVLAPVGLAGGRGAILIGRDLNLDVHIPLTTARAVFSDVVMKRQSGSFQATEVQVSEVYLSVPDRDHVLADAGRAERIMKVRHPDAGDVSMIVPYELLASARRSAMTWNIVLGAIAGISLLVGGIGIMNIMLATVTERTREIGVRRALGATRRHIVWQFLVETGVLSTMGGILGVGLGIAAAEGLELVVPLLPKMPLVGQFFNADTTFPTQVTLWSIVVAFCVAAATGLIFGIYPARKAAQQDPIVALRHD
ncbi:MAG: ABC transporter permease [Phycisphaerales bacterium]|nr:ABC transporter permease [Phycisphaerales bacterium]